MHRMDTVDELQALLERAAEREAVTGEDKENEDELLMININRRDEEVPINHPSTN